MIRKAIVAVCIFFLAAVFTAALGLWICSYFVVQDLTWLDPKGPSIGMASSRGTIGLYWSLEPYPYMENARLLYTASGPVMHPIELWWWGREESGSAPPSARRDPVWRWNLGSFAYQVRWHKAWSEKHRQIEFTTVEARLLVIPNWFVCLVTAPLPARWFYVHFRQRKRRRRGLCLHCGYDLRASKDRCPECGKPFLTKGGGDPPK